MNACVRNFLSRTCASGPGDSVARCARRNLAPGRVALGMRDFAVYMYTDKHKQASNYCTLCKNLVQCSHAKIRSQQCTCQHKPLQPVAPLFSQPDGQSPHVLPPFVLVHLRLLSHPPLFCRHSFTSEQLPSCIQNQQHVTSQHPGIIA